jgi:hypothetical protein
MIIPKSNLTLAHVHNSLTGLRGRGLPTILDPYLLRLAGDYHMTIERKATREFDACREVARNLSGMKIRVRPVRSHV